MSHAASADTGQTGGVLDRSKGPLDSCGVGCAVYPRDELWDALREIEDPELAISLVDMGLIVAIEREDAHVALRLTYTMMGCPAMDMIQDDIRSRLLAIAGIESVAIEVVWEPVWTKARLTSEGRDALLLCGVSV